MYKYMYIPLADMHFEFNLIHTINSQSVLLSMMQKKSTCMNIDTDDRTYTLMIIKIGQL